MGCNCKLTPKCPDCLKANYTIEACGQGYEPSTIHSIATNSLISYCDEGVEYSIVSEYTDSIFAFSSITSEGVISFMIKSDTIKGFYKIWFRVKCKNQMYSSVGWVQICVDSDVSITICNDVLACNYEMEGDCTYANSDNCENCDGNTTCNSNQKCSNGVCVDNNPCLDVDCLPNQICSEGDCYCNDTTAINYLSLGNCIFDICTNCEKPLSELYNVDCIVNNNENPITFNFDIKASSNSCKEEDVTIEYSIDNNSFFESETGVQLQTVSTSKEINIAIVIDNSASSRLYRDNQIQSLSDFINELKSGVIFKDCTKVNVSIIPNGLDQRNGDTLSGNHCTSLLNVNNNICSECSNGNKPLSCICNTDLTDDYDGLLDYLEKLKEPGIIGDCGDVDLNCNPDGEFFNDAITNSATVDCPAVGNSDLEGIEIASQLLVGKENPYLLYFTDYKPNSIADPQNDNHHGTGYNYNTNNICSEIIDVTTDLGSMGVNVYSIGLGSKNIPVNNCGSGEEWLNNTTDNVLYIENPNNVFNISELLDSVQGTKLQIKIKDDCGREVILQTFLSNCTQSCPELSIVVENENCISDDSCSIDTCIGQTCINNCGDTVQGIKDCNTCENCVSDLQFNECEIALGLCGTTLLESGYSITYTKLFIEVPDIVVPNITENGNYRVTFSKDGCPDIFEEVQITGCSDTITICNDCSAINKGEVANCEYSDCTCSNGSGLIRNLINDAISNGQSSIDITYELFSSIALGSVDLDDLSGYGSGMSHQEILDYIQQSFDLWVEPIACITGLNVTFTRVFEDSDVNIIIKSEADTSMIASPNTGMINTTVGGPWTYDECTTSSTFSFLFGLTHEVGHLFGLGHTNCSTSLMHDSISGGDDICAIYNNDLTNDKGLMNCLKQNINGN